MYAKTGAHADVSVYGTALSWGVVLTLIYGLYEYNLDFWVIYMLVWMVLGYLFGLSEKENTGSRLPTNMLIYPVAVVVFVFIALVAISELFFLSGQPRSKKAAWYMTPFSVSRTTDTVALWQKDSTFLSNRDIGLIYVFHPRDVDVLGPLAIALEKKNALLEAKEVWQRSVAQDPQNYATWKTYVSFLLRNREDESFFQAVSDRENKMGIPYARGIITDTNRMILQKTIDTSGEEFIVPKMYYLFGLSLVPNSPRVAQDYWISASSLIPAWNYLYIELGSLFLYSLGNEQKAHEVIGQCTAVVPGDRYCNSVLMQKSVLGAPGTLRDVILEM
jgi:hypothetical protein